MERQGREFYYLGAPQKTFVAVMGLQYSPGFAPDEGAIISVVQAYVFSLLPVPVTSEISEARPLAVEADASRVFLSTLILASDVFVLAATWLTAPDKSEPPTLLIDMW
jgi:hypothetical protein